MISGGRKLEVDLAQNDVDVFLTLLAALRASYGDRLFVTDDPNRPQALQIIATYLARAEKVYRELPRPPASAAFRDTASNGGNP